MIFMLFTHNSERVRTRRFFTNGTMRYLINKLEFELSLVFHRYFIDREDKPLSWLYEYTRARIASLYLPEYTELVDLTILENQLLDYCDVMFFRLFTGDRTRLVFRMFKYSEPLLVDKEK